MTVYLVSTLSDIHGTRELSQTQVGRLLPVLACFLTTTTTIITP